MAITSVFGYEVYQACNIGLRYQCPSEHFAKWLWQLINYKTISLAHRYAGLNVMTLTVLDITTQIN